MKHVKCSFVILAAIITTPAAFAAGKGKDQTCTYEICVASGIKHGHSQPAASRWCTAHLPQGDACKNVGK